MVDHAVLVAEMANIERMQMAERLKQAKKRRAQQLKAYLQYEKQLGKLENSKKSKKKDSVTSKAASSSQKRSNTRLRFDSSILLLDAAARCDKDEVNNLLNSGVSPDTCNEDGLTALHQCCIDDLEDIMKVLIEFGANVNSQDSELWTPLHAAATCGHVQLCKYLCQHGSNLLAVNADGNMPYDLCEDPATLDFIESEMARQGVTQELIDNTRLSVENAMLAHLKDVVEKNGDLEHRGRNGETPLHVAACNGYMHVIEFLIANHVAVNVVDNDEWQPIHCAACWGQMAAIEMLLEHGADVEAKTRNGETTIDLCEELEMKQRIMELIEEMQNKQPHKPSTASLGIRRNSTRRGSAVSPASHACMRRSSLHEKYTISMKDARDEAARMRESLTSLDDEDIDDGIQLDAITTTITTTEANGKNVSSKTPPQIRVSTSIDTDLSPNSSTSSAAETNKRLRPTDPKQPPNKEVSSGILKVKNDSKRPMKEKTVHVLPSDMPQSGDIWQLQGAPPSPTGGNVAAPTAAGPATAAAGPATPMATVSVNQNSSSSPTGNHINNGKASQKPTTDTKTRPASIATSSDHKSKSSSSKHMSFSPTAPDKPAPPSGTLSDLKRQRALKLQEVLQSHSEAGGSRQTGNNGGIPNGLDTNANNGHVAGLPADDGTSTTRRKYSNTDEIVEGDGDNGRGCCCVM